MSMDETTASMLEYNRLDMSLEFLVYFYLMSITDGFAVWR